MASSLLSNVSSDSQHRANLLTNRRGRIKVMVENDVDVIVWSKILRTLTPGQDYEISPFSSDPSVKGQGKKSILKMASGFGPNMIGWGDRERDWILSQWSSEGDEININPYILQTYAYSIENLALQPYGISACMLECTAHSCDLQLTLDRDYRDFLDKISKAVYPVLIWHLTLLKENRDIERVKEGLDFLFSASHYSRVITDNSIPLDLKRTKTINIFQKRCEELEGKYLRQYPDLIPLTSVIPAGTNLDEKTAYLYVRGHDLYDFLQFTFFSPVEKEMITMHTAEIKAKAVNNQAKADALKNYRSLRQPFAAMKIRNMDFLSDRNNFFVRAIERDCRAIIRP